MFSPKEQNLKENKERPDIMLLLVFLSENRLGSENCQKKFPIQYFAPSFFSFVQIYAVKKQCLLPMGSKSDRWVLNLCCFLVMKIFLLNCIDQAFVTLKFCS